MDYKKQYLKLFNTVTDTLSTLQTLMIRLSAVQLSCEDDLSGDDSPIGLERDE